MEDPAAVTWRPWIERATTWPGRVLSFRNCWRLTPTAAGSLVGVMRRSLRTNRPSSMK